MVAASEPTSWLFSNSYILFHLVQHWGPWLAVWAVSLLRTGLITRTLTPKLPIQAIRSLTGVGRLYAPLPDQASPKAISGRTSYLHVRLEFHPYPHLILTLFNGYRFGPPHIFTCVSTWTWVDHCGFGSTLPDLRPLKTRFRFGSAFPA